MNMSKKTNWDIPVNIPNTMKTNKKSPGISQLIFRILLMCMAVACFSTPALADYKTFYDTFNYDTIGAKSSDANWTITTGGNGTVTVDNSIFANGLKLADTNSTGTNGVVVDRLFPAETGRVAFETKFLYKVSGSNYNTFVVEISGTDNLGVAKKAARFVCYADGKMGLDNNGSIVYMPAADGSVKINKNTSGTVFYTLRIVMDTSTGTLDLYLTSTDFAGFAGVSTPGTFNPATNTYYICGQNFYNSGVVGFNKVEMRTEDGVGAYYVDYISTAEFPRPPTGHPRLFARSADIAALKAKVETAGSHANYAFYGGSSQSVMSLSNTYSVTSCILPASPPAPPNYPDASLYTSANVIRKAVEATALRYLLYGDTTLGDKAKNMALNFLNTVVFYDKTSPNYSPYPVGDTLDMGAEVYDWCYDRLSAADKATFISDFEKIAAQLEVGYPPTLLGGVTGHGTGPQLLRDSLSVGVAIFDEKPEMYDVAASRISREFVNVRNFTYTSGMPEMGFDYGTTKIMYDMFPELIFNAMGFPDIFNTGLHYMPYGPIYGYRPDNQTLRSNDMSSVNYPFGSTFLPGPASYGESARYFNDSYIQGQFQSQYYPTYDSAGISSAMEILLYNNNDTGVSRSSLPLTRYFDSPTASMIARTGWGTGQSDNSVIAFMKIGGYNFNNHGHLDNGQFQLYYKGALAIDSGEYDSYGSTHDSNYHKRSIAHNVMLVMNPSESFHFQSNQISNDGGQRWPNNGYEAGLLEDLLNKGYKTSDVVAWQFGPDATTPEYSYIKGNLTASYSSKISKYQRSMMFLNLMNSSHPGALIVYDRVASTNSSFQKYWLLHSINEPTVSGSITTITNTTNGYAGKLVNTTLLPTANTITKVGGTGHEFDVFGTNYPPTKTYGEGAGLGSDEPGAWRIQLSPATAALDDTFLNVMEVLDSTGTPLTPTEIDSTFMVGVQIADRVAMFSKSGDPINATVSFTSTGTGTLKYVVTDLAAGNWTISGAGASPTSYLVTAGGGTLSFTANAAATITLTPQ